MRPIDVFVRDDNIARRPRPVFDDVAQKYGFSSPGR
jgi:hypothetical protein